MRVKCQNRKFDPSKKFGKWNDLTDIKIGVKYKNKTKSFEKKNYQGLTT